MEHEIAVAVWNEFIAPTINKGCNFSFSDLEKRIKEVKENEDKRRRFQGDARSN